MNWNPLLSVKQLLNLNREELIGTTTLNMENGQCNVHSSTSIKVVSHNITCLLLGHDLWATVRTDLTWLWLLTWMFQKVSLQAPSQSKTNTTYWASIWPLPSVSTDMGIQMGLLRGSEVAIGTGKWFLSIVHSNVPLNILICGIGAIWAVIQFLSVTGTGTNTFHFCCS